VNAAGASANRADKPAATAVICTISVVTTPSFAQQPGAGAAAHASGHDEHHVRPWRDHGQEDGGHIQGQKMRAHAAILSVDPLHRNEAQP
jgi:hypothetical protein